MNLLLVAASGAGDWEVGMEILVDSFLIFLDMFWDCREHFISKIRGFWWDLSFGATVLSNDENLTDFGGFEVLMKKMKNRVF